MKKKATMEKATKKASSVNKAMALTEDERKALRKHFLDKMVRLPIGLWMGRFQVTQADWKLVMEINPSFFPGDDLPVETVSWNDCQNFIRRLNELTGETFRLPTEEEWEKACRAGSNGDWGNVKEGVEGTPDEMCWYLETSFRKSPHPVGQKRSNAWGLYDMHGNVWEWTSTSCDEDGHETVSGVRRVVRGGSFEIVVYRCTASMRDWMAPDYLSRNRFEIYKVNLLGFRLALSQMKAVPVGKGKGDKKQAVSAEHGSRGSGKRGAARPEIPTAIERVMRLSATEKKRLRKHFLDKMVPIPLSPGLRMGKFQVTQADWKILVSWNPSDHQGDDLPVENVSLEMCNEFITLLNTLTGKDFRLPTEEEWEQACRAGSKGSWGNVKEGVEGTLDEMGWYDENSDFELHPVGQKRPNTWGLYDMHGNVREWTTGRYSEESSCGGGYGDDAECCTASSRHKDNSIFHNINFRNNGQGFRLALSRNGGRPIGKKEKARALLLRLFELRQQEKSAKEASRK